MPYISSQFCWTSDLAAKMTLFTASLRPVGVYTFRKTTSLISIGLDEANCYRNVPTVTVQRSDVLTVVVVAENKLNGYATMASHYLRSRRMDFKER